MDIKKCPRCRRSLLVKTTGNSAKMEVCSRCAGMWCCKSDWIDSVHGTHESVRNLAAHLPAGEIPDDQATDDAISDFSIVKTQNLNCPDCHSEMLELAIGNPPFTVIEQCDQCGGIWLDHLEDNDLIALKAWSEHHEGLKTELTWGNWWFQLLSQFPIEFNIRPHRVPWVTYLLIAICFVIFLTQTQVGQLEWFLYAHVPNLYQQGYQWWSPLTSIFMHGGFFHLVGNMYFLWLFGDNLEDAFGHFIYTCFFLVCGLVAIIGYHYLNLNSGVPVIGASGAISGMMAAYMILFRHAKLTFMIVFWQRRLSALIWVSIWMAFNIVLMIIETVVEAKIDLHESGGIAWSAHIFGFMAGVIIVFPLRKRIVATTPILRVMEWGATQAKNNDDAEAE